MYRGYWLVWLKDSISGFGLGLGVPGLVSPVEVSVSIFGDGLQVDFEQISNLTSSILKG